MENGRIFMIVNLAPYPPPHPEAGVLVRKLSQLELTRLSLAKRANPRYFILLCGISCELAGCVQWPTVDSEPTISG